MQNLVTGGILLLERINGKACLCNSGQEVDCARKCPIITTHTARTLLLCPQPASTKL